MSVRSLAYIGVAVENPDAWLRFATDVLGLMPADDADGPGRLRVDHRAWRIAVEQGSRSDIAFAGFEVSSEGELAAMQRKLTALGVAVSEDDGALAADRGVTRLIRCRDPIGMQVEIFYGATDRFEKPFASPQAVSGFVTGDQGLGHVVLGGDDIGALRTFYAGALGFRRSDIIRMEFRGQGKRELEFYHCNPRHHTIALVPARGVRRIFHFMLQVASFDDVGFAMDRVQAAGARITATLGRHTNDHMISFYAETPGGIEVEYGFGARVVDDAVWTEALHHKPSIWGHKRG
ncbi:MAG: VOC family protein [Proteobacteria bacterium]|nr:VOC family protein [Pseudomonadota bacterium]